MISEIEVCEILDDGSAKSYGFFDFAELPRAGDRLMVGNSAGFLDCVEVKWAEHRPLGTNPPSEVGRLFKEANQPKVKIIARFLFEYE